MWGVTIKEATTRCKALVLELRRAGLGDVQIGTVFAAALGADHARAALAASPEIAKQIASGLRAIRQVSEIARQIETMSGPRPVGE